MSETLEHAPWRISIRLQEKVLVGGGENILFREKK